MNYAITLYGKRGKVQSFNFRNKRRVFHCVQVQNFSNGTLRVTYDSTKDLWNEGEFTDYKTFKELLNVFTEKLLTDYLKGWE